MKTIFALAVAVLLLIPISVAAHHAFAAEFDRAKPVKVQGASSKSNGLIRTSGFMSTPRTKRVPLFAGSCEGGSRTH
jgi:hypothetical protein